ncbi:MAG: TRAP transporter substrate-binding protein [Oscillospiraceae bacterium]|nr:TRAP transporter substrate-binding protein [Oscillospiraceae bacterium]
MNGGGVTKRILFIVVLLLCLTGCRPEAAEAVPAFVLTYAENQPESYPTTLGAQEFARLVEERTGGEVVILVKHSGELGSEAEVLSQMYFGGIDFARVSLSSVSDELPVLNVLQLPFLYEDADHMWRILDGAIGEDFLKVFSQRNLVGLSWYDAGARCFYSNVPVHCAEDLRGLTVRVQDSQMMKDMVQLLGADAVSLPYSDVYAAFETGQIDAAENNWAAYRAQEHHRLAKFYSMDQHTRVPEIQLCSARTWAQLPEEYRQTIVQCARESALYERQLWDGYEQEARSFVIARGCQEISLDEDALAEFRKLVQPLYGRYCADYLDLIQQIQTG